MAGDHGPDQPMSRDVLELSETFAWEQVLPLVKGAAGEAVRDLRRRLASLGHLGMSTDHDRAPDELAVFDEATTQALRAFQAERGLRPDGVCGRETWFALVEASYHLGDRLLYRRRNLFRGDDVAELQRRLSSLGFDPGGIDGIFGDQTAAAVHEFQRNVGVAPDGICGPAVLAHLIRLSRTDHRRDAVSALREQLVIGQQLSTLRPLRIAVGEAGGFPAGVAALCRALGRTGSVGLPLHDPDSLRQVAEANAAKAHCYVGLALNPELSGVHCAYYAAFHYESISSRQLAESIEERVAAALGLPRAGSQGMALTILRETHMPAVLVELGPPSAVTQQTSPLAEALLDALTQWRTTAEQVLVAQQWT
jgi:N-acetylmuramoyl-L-alanine amidase